MNRDLNPPHPEKDEPLERELTAAHRLLLVNRPDLARERLQRALALDPNDSWALFLLAWVQAKQKEWSEAEASLHEALRLDSEDPDGLALLGACRREAGRYAEAEQHYLEALHLAPERADLLAEYGELLRRAGNPRKAEQVLSRSLELEPDNSQAHVYLSFLFHGENNHLQARHHALEAVRLDPDAPDAYVLLCSLEFRRGSFFRAREYAEAALRVAPERPDAQGLHRTCLHATRPLWVCAFWCLGRSLAYHRPAAPLPGLFLGAVVVFFTLVLLQQKDFAYGWLVACTGFYFYLFAAIGFFDDGTTSKEDSQRGTSKELSQWS